MSDPNEVVGHKTLRGDDGRLYHEPLMRTEAEALWAKCEAEDTRRRELMPDEASANRTWIRLKEHGWREACYCPKDGSEFEVIEAGSTGYHRCIYEGEWPTGRYWIVEPGDMSPSRPVLFRPLSAKSEPTP